MLDTQVFSYQFVLGTNIVKESYMGERFNVGVRWRSGLAIPKESCNDDKVLLGIQSVFLSNQPFIIGDRLGLLARYWLLY
jgi:hypothetical protein